MTNHERSGRLNVAHVVTLISEDASFGGPVSVARAQAVELARRGHRVWLLAGWDNCARPDLPGVQVRLSRTRKLLPTAGFSAMAAPGVLRNLWRLRNSLDVVHLHLARDLVTLPAGAMARVLRVPIVTQTHGMVMPDRRAMSRVIDGALTRPLLSAARTVTYLTTTERAGLDMVARGHATLSELQNGVPGPQRRQDHADVHGSPVVLFCARLHPRKRVLAFAEMAKLLVSQGSPAQFVVAGPDEGELPALQRFIRSEHLESRLSYAGPIRPEDVRAQLGRASVFVLPSEQEPFPMTLLEALSEGVPSVITDGCMIADRLGDAVVVTDGSATALAEAVRTILGSADRSAGLRRRSVEIASSRFGIGPVVDVVESLYRSARS